MSICYKPLICENCGRQQAGRASYGQYILCIFLLCLFIIPGVVYYFVAKPNCCYICGIKRRHRTHKEVPKPK